MLKKHREFNKKLMKEDLNKEELKCYNKLMVGIEKASVKEKKEVAHLMEVFIETDETVYTNCARCGKRFEEVNKNIKLKDKKIYCDKCLEKMWS